MSADTEATKAPRITWPLLCHMLTMDPPCTDEELGCALRLWADQNGEIEYVGGLLLWRRQMADISTCRLCGRSPAEGWAVADNGAGFPIRLCHGASQQISCYVRWTTYGERAVVETETGDEA